MPRPIAATLLLMVSFVTLDARQVPVPPPPPRPPVPPAGQGPQNPARDNSKMQVPIGTALISGVVTAGDSGRPLAGARLSLNGSNDLQLSRSVQTDEQGRFAFAQLPAGQFSLSASRPRYLSTSFGQKAPERPGTPIRLTDGQQMKNVTLRLIAGGVITGAVVDEHGEPSMNTEVRVMRYTMRSGVRQLTQAGQGATDDRGVYRVHGLVPGDYLVSAVARPTGNLQGDLASARIEMAIAAHTSTGSAPTPEAGGVPAAITIDNPFQNTDVSAPTYASTFYPGSTTIQGATTIKVGAGEERAGVDFQLQLVPTVSVQGVVVNAGGPLPAGLNVQLMNEEDGAAGFGSSSARVDADGRFTFRNVAPGQYAVTARANAANAAVALAAAAARLAALSGAPVSPQAQPPAQRPQLLFGRAQIAVSSTPITNVTVTLESGRSVSGHVVFDGTTAAKPDLSHARVTVTLTPAPPQTPGMSLPASSATVTADGGFTVPGVLPGRYLLRASGTQGWYLKSSIVSGQDTLDLGLEITGDQDVPNAVITFVDRATELTGQLQDAQGQGASDYTIIVFAADSRFWTPSSRRIVQTRPATDGRYIVRGLQPGDYCIAAVTDVEPGGWYDPELLRALLPVSARVTLGDGDKKTQDLRVGR